MLLHGNADSYTDGDSNKQLKRTGRWQFKEDLILKAKALKISFSITLNT
jgi:hypothetical protein